MRFLLSTQRQASGCPFKDRFGKWQNIRECDGAPNVGMFEEALKKTLAKLGFDSDGIDAVTAKPPQKSAARASTPGSSWQGRSSWSSWQWQQQGWSSSQRWS